MESKSWQLKEIKWEDEHLKQVKDLNSNGGKNFKNKKKKVFNNEKIIVEGEDGKKLYMLKGYKARNRLNW